MSKKLRPKTKEGRKNLKLFKAMSVMAQQEVVFRHLSDACHPMLMAVLHNRDCSDPLSEDEMFEQLRATVMNIAAAAVLELRDLWPIRNDGKESSV